jgi:hypothetical protein
MPTPINNLGFSNIQSEFGGFNPIGLNEYYRGGAYVDINQPKSPFWPVPISTAGEISAGMFRGMSKAVVYTNDGSTLSGWNLHPQNTGGGVQNWTQVYSSGGNPGAYIRTRSDNWRQNWIWRNISLSQYNYFTLRWDSWIQSGSRCLPGVQLGAVSGNGPGLLQYFNRISTCTWTSYGAAATSIVDVGSHASVVGKWTTYEIQGTRLSPVSFSFQITVTDIATNTVILSMNLVIPSGMGGDEWSFRYTGDVGGNGEHQKIDNIYLIRY